MHLCCAYAFRRNVQVGLILECRTSRHVCFYMQEDLEVDEGQAKKREEEKVYTL